MLGKKFTSYKCGLSQKASNCILKGIRGSGQDVVVGCFSG